jgi:hypothetical protein
MGFKSQSDSSSFLALESGCELVRSVQYRDKYRDSAELGEVMRPIDDRRDPTASEGDENRRPYP